MIREIDPSVKEAVDANGGYCPCLVDRTPDTKCMCKDFREMEEGVCHCGRFEKFDGPKVTMIEYPTERDWLAVKERALVTVGLKAKNAPDIEWKDEILEARHSPIRRLRFAFLIEELPYWVSVHLCRHIHAQPYVRSQRNDRQAEYDRNAARQDAPVTMIWDMTGEELLIVANKRLCSQAIKETRDVVQKMCDLVAEKCPEFKRHLVPMCEYHGGICHEMKPCGRCSK
jgi:thymidylate synthase ThyX